MDHANIYALLTPIVFAVMLIEIIFSLVLKRNFYRFNDTIASLGSAIGNQVVNIWMILLFYIGLKWFYDFHSFGHLELNWVNLIVLNLGLDLAFYLAHRMSHWNSMMWAAHAPHHSSNELNYATGVRSGVLQRFFHFPFLVPFAVAGFAPEVILGFLTVQHVVQLLAHTRVVKNFGVFDAVLNSPAHHRVHHARNPQYIDKNFGGLLIIWDKLFGSYEPEVEPCVYGVTVPIQSLNPIQINTHYWKYIWNDCKAAPHFTDKIKIWFMPTGWKPRGVNTTWKGEAIVSSSEPSTKLKAYIVFQLIITVWVMLQVTHSNSVLNTPQKLLMAAITWMSIVSWTAMLEAKPWAKKLDIFKNLILIAACLMIWGSK